MQLTRAVTRFAAGNLVLPAAQGGQLSVGGMRISFELIFVTVLAGVAANVITGGRLVVADRRTTNRLRSPRGR